MQEDEAYLDKALADIAGDIVPDRIFTTGSLGYDGHPDHIATHSAAARRAEDMRLLGREVTLWSLMADGSGELQVYGDLERKLGSMAFHASQRAVPDLTRWGDTDLYTPAILGPETYNN
jgi:LmbE family N-acetylglucosaminyl deacetylase